MPADDPVETFLTASGAPYALQEVLISGQPYRVFRHGPRTLPDIYRKAMRCPDAPLLAVDGEQRTCRSIFGDAAKLMAALRRQFGVKTGMRVGIAIGNRPEAIVAFVAVTALGATAVLTDHRRSSSDRSVFEIAECDVAISCAPTEDINQPVLVSVEKCPAGKTDTDRSFFADIMLEEDCVFSLEEIDPESEAVIAFTSGTTGRPKGVVATHRAMTTGLMNMMLAGSLANAGRPSQRQKTNTPVLRACALLLSPFSHVSGYTQFLLQMLLGGKLVLGEESSVQKIAESIEKEKVRSVVGLTPSKMRALLDVATDFDLSSLAAFHVNGYALHGRLVDTISTALPYVTIGTSYGMTETNGGICALAGDKLKNRPLSSGRVVPTVDIKIVGSDKTELSPGQTGEIWIRGAMLFAGYCGADANTLVDGWFRTGDLGYLSDDRHLTIVDRLQDAITVGDKTIACLSVERAVMELPNVDEATVLVSGSTTTQSDIIVVIVPSTESEPNIIAIRRQIFEQFGLNPRIEMSCELPRSASGKIDSFELKRQFVQGR